MSAFIFQSTPERYDLREKLRSGCTDTWYATRYRAQMAINDVVYFWMSGDDDIRGIYGWGRIKSAPYLRDDWSVHGVDVVYGKQFETPILSKELKKNSILSKMLIIRAPQSTNFILTEDEISNLENMLEERGEPTPSEGAAT